ncbi:MAG: rhamnose ABC transporter substrate-binding protein [Thermoleophilaceae bacterium]
MSGQGTRSRRGWSRLALFAALVAAVTALAACGAGDDEEAGGKELDVVFLPKAINIPYFDAALDGAREAAGELKGEVKQVGPSEGTAAAQIPFINNATSQQVGALAIAGNDPNAVAPALKRAQENGVKVVAWDSDVSPDARAVFVNQATSEAIAKVQLESIAKQMDFTGEFAILSSFPTATNQNTWIKIMRAELEKPEYADMELVKVAYGEEDDQKSFTETQGLLRAYPSLKGIISPMTIGPPAAARALESSGKAGKVALNGLALPNPMRQYVKNGTVKEFMLWNVPDLGYLAYYAAAAYVKGDITGKEGEKLEAGRLGEKTIGKNGEIVLGPPLVFTKENIDKYKF